MPHIMPLEKHVAELIAAGEVVERPASVVKELVENAVDAGATAVAVSIRRGGMGLIRVADNGCGIAPEELPVALLRHATSKLRTTAELGRIETLGFRGEALAAIASVSRMELLSRERGRDTGAVIRVEGGAAGPVEEIGAPEGTTVTVRDLFFNTPARLKFMRKDSAEAAAVAGLMQHLALSRPDIAFRLDRDGSDVLHTPGDGRLESAVYAALGRDFARTLIPVRGRGGDVAVEGFLTKPLLCRASRSMQTFFVNGRFIKSQLLTAAVEESYRNQIMKGKFPGCVLFVTLPAALVDVNVHPAKTQVKFAREHDVFDAVYHTALDTLNALGSVPRENLPGQGGAVASAQGASGYGASGYDMSVQGASPVLHAPVRQDFYQSMDAETYRKQRQGRAAGPRSGAFPGWPVPGLRRENPIQPEELRGQRIEPPEDWDDLPEPQREISAQPDEPSGQTNETPIQPDEMPGQPDDTSTQPSEQSEQSDELSGQPNETPIQPDEPPGQPDELSGQQSFSEETAPSWRIAGELLRTYIVCEDGTGNVWLIDKHAAHERVNFDRLLQSETPPMRQTLLASVAVDPGREAAELLLDNLPLLESMGFLCEDFGDGSVLVREIPADLEAEDAAAALEELAEDLRTGRSPREKREAMLRTIACKASIKGGWDSDWRELQALVDRVQTGEIRFCPHGRPVAVKLTAYELEKMFRRA